MDSYDCHLSSGLGSIFTLFALILMFLFEPLAFFAFVTIFFAGINVFELPYSIPAFGVVAFGRFNLSNLDFRTLTDLTTYFAPSTQPYLSISFKKFRTSDLSYDPLPSRSKSSSRA